ncbi:hypothetical protein PCNPT3_00860 [Psychromonas sp. CNPT3]|uniref:CpaD family pilus assembly lipoprotein n=1 Tax=Psychromonas sp. CNPT3 TaxID=314282 RepID=UPI00006E70BA|nr:CpaD family pilus assembly lipoprotein [Psychromonas sp. CNPT3]AGH80114.1 hypothetical protein PCNPT3_00860 [Psychromonas sp. CNPT3]
MRLLLTILLSSALLACTSQPMPHAPEIPVQVLTDQFALTLQGNTLNTLDKKTLQQFFSKRGDPSNLRVRLTLHTRAGMAQKKQLQKLLKTWRITADQLEIFSGPQEKQQASAADFTFVVESYRALARHCQAQKDASIILNNFKRNPNFGCANSNALALMIANPRELLRSATLAPMEGRKAVSIIESYYSQPTQRLNQSSPISGAMSGSTGN